MSNAGNRKAKVDIVISDDGCYLQATITPEMADSATTGAYFQQQLCDEKYKDFFPLDDGIKKALEACQKNDQPLTCNIARLKFATVELSISEDGRHVVAAVTPRSGEVELTKKELERLLKQDSYRQYLPIEGANDSLEQACRDNNKVQHISVGLKHEMSVTLEKQSNEQGIDALLTPCSSLEKVTEKSLRQQISKEFERYRILEDRLAEVLALCEANATKTKIQIAEKKYPSVSLAFSDEKQAVVAQVQSCVSEEPVDKEQLLKQLSAWPEQMLDEKSFDLLMQCCAANNSSSQFVITTLRPPLLEFSLSENGKAVIVTGTPQKGEQPLSMKLINSELTRNGYTHFAIQDDAYAVLEKQFTDNNSTFQVEIAKKLFPEVTLEVEKSSGKELLARITPHATITELTQEQLVSQIEAFEDFSITTIDRAMAAYSQNDKATSVAVALKREPLVTLSLDETQEYLQCHIVPVKGNDPITQQWLERQIRTPEYLQYHPIKANILEALDLCDKNDKESVVNIARILQASVSLKISASGRHLVATVVPQMTPETFTEEQLTRELRQDLYREFFVIEEARDKLLAVCAANREEASIEIAEKRETAVELIVNSTGDGVDARYEACSAPEKVTKAWLVQQFSGEQLGRFRPMPQPMEQLLAYCEENKRSGELRLGERRDPEVTFHFDATTNKVSAVMKPCSGERPVDKDYLSQLLTEQHYNRYFLFQDNVEILLKQCQENETALTIEIAERRDGELELQLDDDNFPLSAYVVYSKAYGGKEITEQQVDAFFKEKNITTTLLSDQVSSLKLHLETTVGPSCWIIARGKDVVNGLDSQFIWLTSEAGEENVSDVNKTGTIDLRAARNVTAVKPGDRVMRIDPPTQGEPGLTIFGESIQPKAGEVLTYSNDLQGTEIDSTDERYLVATINGAPVVVERGMHVLDVLLVDKVDMATGDINFEGNVMIKSDVETGSTVECTGNLSVGGTIENAMIKVGGDLVVGGGIVGEAPAQSAESAFLDESLAWKTHIEVQGDIYGKYISNALVTGKGNINISDYTSHSVLIADKEIHIGTKSNSAIIGGKTKAGLLVAGQNIGNESEVKTRVEVGSLKALRSKKSKIVQLREEKQATSEKLKNALELLQQKNSSEPADVEYVEKLENTIAALMDEIDKCNRAIVLTDQKLEVLKTASIELKQFIYGGVTIVINDKEQSFSRKTAVDCLSILDGEITNNQA